MTMFEVGKFYSIHISHLSASCFKCIKRTDKTVWFQYFDKVKSFRIKQSEQGESFFSNPLWGESFGEQKYQEYND